jgi:xylulokinase
VDGLAIGIDIGSSALKALAVDESGQVVASLRRTHRLDVPTPDRMEHQAGDAWRRAPRKVLEQLQVDLRAKRDDRPIVGVCVAGMVPSLAAVDELGIPSSPGLLYGDARGAAATSDRALRTSAGPTGHAPDLLRYCATVAPEAAGYWPAQAVANYALTGKAVVDTSTAFAMAPLFNGESWSEDEVQGSGAETRQLPEVVSLGRTVGEWGRGVPVASGIVDTLAEQLVAGAVDDGDVLVICGTTLVVWCVTSNWREIPGLWTVPHVVPGKVLIGGASNAGALFLEWARRLAPARHGRVAAKAHVPVWAPYPRGERTPLHDPQRRAMLVDLQLSDGPAAVRRAAAEATGFVVRQHIELAGIDARRVVATGGGTHDDEWMAALADSTGLPVQLVAVPEGGALGAAFVARMAAGLETSLVDAGRWARAGQCFAPGVLAEDASNRYQLFRDLSRA